MFFITALTHSLGYEFNYYLIYMLILFANDEKY